MNVYELADELDKYKGIATRDASTMLRQQADRITELEFNIRMNEMKYLERIEELESHKELSDEEIISIEKTLRYSELSIGQNDYFIRFARAIIKGSRGEE